MKLLYDLFIVPIQQTLIPLLLNPFAQITIGALITWFVSWWYYKRAGDDLAVEAEQLKKETATLIKHNVYQLIMLEQLGAVKLRRSENGEIIGVKYVIEAKLPKIRATPNANMSFTSFPRVRRK